MPRLLLVVVALLGCACAAPPPPSPTRAQMRSSLLDPLFPPAPRRAQPPPRPPGAAKAALIFQSINVRDDRKVIRAPLVTLLVSVNAAAPLRVELKSVSDENLEYSCARSGAALPSTCEVADVIAGDVITVQVVEANSNVTLMQPRDCRFMYEDLSQPKICNSRDIRSVIFNCRGCTPATPPIAYATLESVRLEEAQKAGRVALACTSPGQGNFLLALPKVADAGTVYSCADSGASSCRLARLAPGERINCAVIDPAKATAPGAALLQASACRPTLEDLRARPVDCQSRAVRLTLGCEGC